MKECRGIREQLSTYLDEAVSPGERVRIEAHLAGCPRCRTALAELHRAVTLVREQEPVEAPPWLTAKIMARVRSEAAPRRALWERLFVPLAVKVPLQAVALLAMCVTGYYLARSTQPQLDFAPPPTRFVEPATPAPVPVSPSSPPARTPQPTAPVPVLPRDAAMPAPAEQQPAAPAPAPAFAPPPPTPMATPAAPLLPAAARSLPAADREAKEETLRAMPPAGASLEEARPQLQAPAEKRALKAELPAPGSLSSVAAPLAVRLTAADPARAGATIAELVRQLDGTVIARHDDPPSSLTARVAAHRLPELLNRLARLGSLREKPAIDPDATGAVSFIVSW